MQNLRNHHRLAHRIARWVLVWFSLYLGAAVAGPLLHPVCTQLVCSAFGAVKVVALNAGADTEQGVPLPHSLDCPLCAGVGAPPPVALLALTSAPPATGGVVLAGARLLPAAPIAAPPQARAPPRWI